MPVDVAGVRYFSAAEVLNRIGVARQTLWRWRQNGKIPAGHRFRDRQIFFTATEVDAVLEFANRMEPVDEATSQQLRLFGGRERR